jgi:hypothetical protein
MNSKNFPFLQKSLLKQMTQKNNNLIKFYSPEEIDKR